LLVRYIISFLFHPLKTFEGPILFSYQKRDKIMIPDNSDKNVLSERTVDPDPVVQFSKWYTEHLEAGIAIPDTVSLGTASTTGRVSVRTVLLKGYDKTGFVFFTNYNSKKGMQISENPSAALLFYWPEMGRQVRIEGMIEKISDSESETYFSSRLRESQLGAWASEQSSVIPHRLHLEKRYHHFESRFNNIPVRKPPHWGGFRIIPDLFEFWQNGEFRLHDRIVFEKENDAWVIKRLSP
jgi:pyridoxamine 5'-phosphate oxidase